MYDSGFGGGEVPEEAGESNSPADEQMLRRSNKEFFEFLDSL